MWDRRSRDVKEEALDGRQGIEDRRLARAEKSQILVRNELERDWPFVQLLCVPVPTIRACGTLG